MKKHEVYALIARKPASSDYCRGCLMASYSGDFILEKEISRESLIRQLTQVLWTNENLDTNEAGYDQIEVLKGWVEEYDPELEDCPAPTYQWLNTYAPEYDELMQEAGKAVAARKQKEAQEQQAKLAAERQRQAEATQQKELQELNRLRSKYG